MKEKFLALILYIDEHSQTSGYRAMMDKPQSPMLLCCLTLTPKLSLVNVILLQQ